MGNVDETTELPLLSKKNAAFGPNIKEFSISLCSGKKKKIRDIFSPFIFDL